MKPSIKKRVVCDLCHHRCRLSPGQIGRCGVRQGAIGKIESLVYGKLVAENVDPIEKKPLFHVLPGTLTYSIATRGCNFRCLHCQNSSISQVADGLSPLDGNNRQTITRMPQEVVDRALGTDCKSISYTYVEPTVFFEYAYDCAILAKQQGLGNIFVSNGYMSDTVLNLLAPVLTAINIDLKSWSESFYKKVCGARLAPVVENIRKCIELGIWVEVTTLLIPGMNDSASELKDIAMFLAGLDRNIPWHVTAFYPTYKMTGLAPTPISTINLARQIGIDCGLHYVYSGNVSGGRGMATDCPACGDKLIARSNFTLQQNLVTKGTCPSCHADIAGVWK
ncbi:MAG: pyruvate formate lyase activating enzyme [Desulforhopalus sp.]|jgi:pyruvate formate lyase activating enzyme